jgi:tetratricopeptide (TPR) repeat protein
LVRLEDATGAETVVVFFADQTGAPALAARVSKDIAATTDWNAVGQIFDSLNSIDESANEHGFVLARLYDTPKWPARIVSTEAGTNTVNFELRSGRTESYTAGYGVRLKIVYAVDSAANKNVLVFRSIQAFPAGVPAPSVAASQPAYDSETNLRRILEQQRAQLGDDHTNTALAALELANVLMRQGKSAEAEQMSRDALVVLRKDLGNDDLAVANTLGVLCSTLLNQDKLAEAETARRENLAIRLKVLGEADPKVALSYEALGSILQREGKLSEAEESLRNALAIRRKIFGEQSSQVRDTLAHLNEALKQEGKPAE